MVVEDEEKCVGNAEEAVDVALEADWRKCYACGVPLGPHTAPGADAVAGGGEYDDNGGH